MAGFALAPSGKALQAEARRDRRGFGIAGNWQPCQHEGVKPQPRANPKPKQRTADVGR
jgi:hypothetical protein